METWKLPPGSRCEECGELVTEKEIIEGESVPLGLLGSITAPDRMGRNLPCGHNATATWSLEESVPSG